MRLQASVQWRCAWIVLFSIVAPLSLTAGSRDAPLVPRTGVSRMDKTFASAAARGLMRDMSLADIAARRAERPALIQFAQAVHRHRTEAYAGLVRLARKTRLVMPRHMDAKQQQQVEQLNQLTGRDLEQRFLQLIATPDYPRFFEFELQSGALRVDPKVKSYARNQLQILRNDIDQAQWFLRT